MRFFFRDAELLFDVFLVVEDFGKDEPEHAADKTGNGRDVVEDFRDGLLIFRNTVGRSIEPDPGAEQNCEDADEDAEGFHNFGIFPQNYNKLVTTQNTPAGDGRGCGH